MKGIELIGGHSKSILNRNLVQFEEKVRVSKLDVIITNAKESCWILFYPDGGGGGGKEERMVMMVVKERSIEMMSATDLA